MLTFSSHLPVIDGITVIHYASAALVIQRQDMSMTHTVYITGRKAVLHSLDGSIIIIDN